MRDPTGDAGPPVEHGVRSLTATSLPRPAASAGRPRPGPARSACGRPTGCARAARRRAGRGSAGSGSGSSVGNHRNPKRRQLLGHRVRADRHRPAVEGGLDRRVAEPLPGAREHDGVGGRVGVGHRAGRRPVDHRARRRGEQPVEHLVVAELGRTEQPVGAAERGGQAQGRRDVLAGDGADRVRAQAASSRRRRGPGGWRRGRRPAGRRRSRCRSWSPRCRGRRAGGG